MAFALPEKPSIAVLPFNTSGPGVELLGEGMVDLFSANLNDVGGIRTVDSRTVMQRWQQRSAEGRLDLEGALAGFPDWFVVIQNWAASAPDAEDAAWAPGEVAEMTFWRVLRSGSMWPGMKLGAKVASAWTCRSWSPTW